MTVFSVDLTTSLLSGLIFIAIVAFSVRANRRSRRRNLPPGPTGIPIFGNLFQLPTLRPHPKLTEWAAQYGEIYYLKLGNQDMVILNTAEAANELLARRSHNYSSRTSGHVAHELLHDGMGLALLTYDAPWKAIRSGLQGALGPAPSKQLRPFQDCESRVLMYDLVNHGDKSLYLKSTGHHVPADGHWYAPVRRYATSVSLRALYGKRVNRFTDNPDLHRVYDIVNNFVEMALPGNYLVDVFPILRSLPDAFAPWRAKARKLHLGELELWRYLAGDCQKPLTNGESRGGFINKYIAQRSAAGIDKAPGKALTASGWMQDDFLAYGAGSALEAGSDTTTMSIATFILYMLSHPCALEKARAEIDRAVGLDRLPDFSDEEQLPYFMACLKETMRLRPATPLALPHAAVEDDFYKGYHIPKGSTVIGNVWAIHRDPKRFFNPNAFIPERFYHEGKPTRWDAGPISHDRDIYAFGWGRRFCQGSHIAEASLFITLSRLLWGVDFYAPVNPETNRPVLPDVSDEEKTWSDGLVSVPHNYKVGFRPRSDRHAEMIRKSFSDVQDEWQMMGLEVDER
ncbi:hypothetical protein FOMPIDRAFT_1131071 [Fomitopsis schrenkii]|uniref:Cytochrome P450 n=1 Tax=Fomitopsis schrenkii TaxID=2126942 RepID=S8DTZ4_FOMSC|nr:hypothetical protein FOMPIDRAFT_1131071 [Fomitopsis schrenkii]